MQVRLLLLFFLLSVVDFKIGTNGSRIDFPFFYRILSSSEPSVNTIYYCQSPQLCSSKDQRFHLSKLSVFTNNGTQTRWYVEVVKHSKKKRLFGAIQINERPLTTKVWKRLSYLLNDSTVAIDEPDLSLTAWEPSCEREHNSVYNLLNAVLSYHRLILVQYEVSGSSSLSNYQQIIAEESKTTMQQCLSIALKEPFNNPIEEDSTAADLLLISRKFLSCFNLFVQQSPVLLEPCDDEFYTLFTEKLQIAQLSLPDNRQYSDVDESLSELLSIRLFYQMLYLNQLSKVTAFLKPVLTQETTKLKQNYNERMRKRLLDLFFLSHLLSGDLGSWEFISSASDATSISKLFLTYAPSSSYCSIIPCEVELDAISAALSQFRAFYQIYVSNQGGKEESNRGHIYDDVLLKIEYVMKKLKSIADKAINTASTRKNEDTALTASVLANEGLERFIVSEYQSYYASLVILNYLMVGMVESASNYFHSQFNQQDNGVVKEVPFDCAHVLSIFFPRIKVEEMSCVFNCERLGSLFHRSRLVRISYKLLLLLHPLPDSSLENHHQLIIQRFLSRSHLLKQYLLILSQIANPVILSDVSYSIPPSQQLSKLSWIDEAVVLRLFFHHIIATFQKYCEGELNNCHNQFDEESVTMMTRGFFLQAYQGVSVFIQYYEKYIIPFYHQHDENKSRLSQELRSSIDQTCWTVFIPQVLLPQIRNDAPVTTYLRLLNLNKTPEYQRLLSAIKTEERGNNKEKDERIRVGILSYSFSRHSVGRLFAKVIAHLLSATTSSHATPLFDVYILTNRVHSKSGPPPATVNEKSESDDITVFLESIISPDHWIDISSLSFFKPSSEVVAKKILFLQLDVLIYTDLLMQATQYLYAYSYRLAKVQVLFWGHPYTSSNPLIDYYITSASFESAHPLFVRHSQYTEQLVYFESLSFQLFPPETFGTNNNSAIELIREERGAQSTMQRRKEFLEKILMIGYTIDGGYYQSRLQLQAETSSTLFQYFHNHFFSKIRISEEEGLNKLHIYAAIQSLMKMHPLFDQAIVKLLQSDPFAVILLLRNQKQHHWQVSWQRRLLRSAEAAGISLDELQHRVIWVNGMKHQEYAQVICSVDVVLDPFPFGGGVTMCDAVAGPCKDRGTGRRSSRGNESSLFGSVPFVTIKDLQSIHAIGAGIAEKVNDSSLTRIVQDNQALTVSGAIDTIKSVVKTSERDFVLQDLFSQYTDALIHEYVKEAITLAEMVEAERKENQVAKEIETGPGDVPDLNPSKPNPHYLIYEDDSALLEWERFLIRISK